MSENLPNIKKINISKNPIHKIGIFGGSFNPPHMGHVLAVQYVKSMVNFEGIFIVPCGNHAFGKDLISFEHRFEMCKLSFLNLRQPINDVEDFGLVQNNMVISDIENRDEVTYAIDTAQLLKEGLSELDEGGIELTWIVGTDCMKDIKNWKDIEKLKKIVKFYEIPRCNSNQIFDTKSILPSISSTSIREKIKKNKDVSGLIPLNVLEYIKENGLYSV